jgi:hypothetical protein
MGTPDTFGDGPDDEQISDFSGTLEIIKKSREELLKVHENLDKFFKSTQQNQPAAAIRQSQMINIFGLKIRTLLGILNNTHPVSDFLWTIQSLISDIEYVFEFQAATIDDDMKLKLTDTQKILTAVRNDFLSLSPKS